MDDCIGPERFECGLKKGHIGEIPLNEPAVEDSPRVPCAQVVIDEDLMAHRPQCLDNMAADVTGASRDEYLYPHFIYSPRGLHNLRCHSF